MYGLIIENFSCYLKHKYGDEAWDQVRSMANLDSPTFSIHQVSTEETVYKATVLASNVPPTRNYFKWFVCKIGQHVLSPPVSADVTYGGMFCE